MSVREVFPTLVEFSNFYRSLVPDTTRSKIVVINCKDEGEQSKFWLSYMRSPFPPFTGWNCRKFKDSYLREVKYIHTLGDMTDHEDWYSYIKMIEEDGYLPPETIPKTEKELGVMYLPLPGLKESEDITLLDSPNFPVIYIVTRINYVATPTSKCPVYVCDVKGKSLPALWFQVRLLTPLGHIWIYWKPSTCYRWNNQLRKWREYLWRPGGPLERKRYTELLQLTA